MQQIPFNDLLPVNKLFEPELSEVMRKVLYSGSYILGESVEEFEQAFAKYCGADHCIGVANATDALTISLASVGVRAGDTVLTVANSAPPTVTAIRRTGASVRFVEIGEDGLMSPEALEKESFDLVKAVVPVHLYGRMCDMTSIFTAVKRKTGGETHIIEDAAQAIGCKPKPGIYSDTACYSFYPTKNLGAIGDAGAITTNNKYLAAYIRAYRNYGLLDEYQAIYGMNSRLDEIQAAILSVKLKQIDFVNESRLKMASMYNDRLAGVKHLTLLKTDQYNAHLYVIQTEDRDHLKEYLKKQGIGTKIHYPIPAYRQEAETAHRVHKPLPLTEAMCSRVLSLPLWYGLTQENINRVCAEVRRFFNA